MGRERAMRSSQPTGRLPGKDWKGKGCWKEREENAERGSPFFGADTDHTPVGASSNRNGALRAPSS